MKKAWLILSAFAVLSACQKTAPDVVDGSIGLSSLTALTAPATRTSTNSSLQVLWSTGDQIAVYGNTADPENATPFTLSGEGGGTTGTFTGETVACGDLAYAVYPYYDNYQGLSAGHITTFIPKTQTYVEGSIPEKSFVMAASFNPQDGKMTFAPISAVLEIRLFGSVAVEKILVEEYADATTVGGKHLTQAQYIYFDNGVPKVYDSNTSGSSNVTLTCPTPVTLGENAAQATSFFIVVGGNTRFHHLKVTVTDSEGNTHVKNTKNTSGEPVSLSPGTVYTLPAFEVSAAQTINLATWGIGKAFSYTFAAGDKSNLKTASDLCSPSATASSGSNASQSTITFFNGSQTTWRTANTGSRGFIGIFANEGDFWLLQSKGVDLKAGDKIDLNAYLVMYASPAPSQYEVQYYLGNLDTSSLSAINGVTWTKVGDDLVITEVGGSTSNPPGAAINTKDGIVVPSAMQNATINIRVIATNNVSINGAVPNANGHIDLRGGKASGTPLTLDLIRP